MIDQRFSRRSFESLRSPIDKQLLARDLAEELRSHIAEARDPDDGLSAALARLRLIGHHLYTATENGEAIVLAGDPSGDEPTGLELELRAGELVDIRYRS